MQRRKAKGPGSSSNKEALRTCYFLLSLAFCYLSSVQKIAVNPESPLPS